MGIACGVREDGFHKVPVDLLQRAAGLRQRLAKTPADLFRNWFPYRTVTYFFQVIQHVIEHAVALRPKLHPIGRIQGVVQGR